MRILFYLVLTAFAAVPALADNTSGTILAFDRVAHIIVLEDNTIWNIVPVDLALPEDLKAGDKITIDFQTNGDNGVGSINSITRIGG